MTSVATSAPADLDRMQITAGAIGNTLEWYDFAIYGFLAPIIGKVFFPSEDHFASLLAAGGITPWFATYLVSQTSDDFAPIYYVMIAAVIAFVATICMPGMRDKPLRD